MLGSWEVVNMRMVEVMVDEGQHTLAARQWSLTRGRLPNMVATLRGKS